MLYFLKLLFVFKKRLKFFFKEMAENSELDIIMIKSALLSYIAQVSSRRRTLLIDIIAIILHFNN